MTSKVCIVSCTLTLANYSQGAVIHYEAALAVDPNFIAAKHNLASAYHSLKHLDKAEQMFQDIVDVRQNCVSCYFVLHFAHAYAHMRL